MDYNRILNVLNKTNGALKRAQESGDIQEMDRLSSYLDRMKPVMGKVEGEIQAQKAMAEPPKAPVAPQESLALPVAQPKQSGDAQMAPALAGEEIRSNSATMPETAMPGDFDKLSAALAGVKTQPRFPGGTLPSQGRSTLEIPMATTPAELQMPPTLAEQQDVMSRTAEAMPVLGDIPREIAPRTGVKKYAPGEHIPKEDRAQEGFTSYNNRPKMDKPVVEDGKPQSGGFATSLGNMGKAIKTDEMVNAVNKFAADGEEKAELERIKAEIGEKPTELSFENLAIMLLMGAPRAFSKIMSDNADYRNAFRSAMADSRKGKVRSARQEKEDAFREREVKAKEDSVKNLKDYRDSGVEAKPLAEKHRDARAILTNPMSTPAQVKWAESVLELSVPEVKR